MASAKPITIGARKKSRSQALRVMGGLLLRLGIAQVSRLLRHFRHPFSALFTAVRIMATFISSPLGMPFGHEPPLPRAIFTIVRISSTVTVPLSLQSPVHRLGVGVLVGVSVGVLVGVLVTVGVFVGVLVRVGVAVGVSVGVAVGVWTTQSSALSHVAP